MTDTEPTDTEPVDYNALDNTLAGRLISAGFIFAITAAPDYTEKLALTWSVLGASYLGAVATANAFDEDPRNDLTAIIEEEQGEAESVATTWITLAGLGAVVVGSVAVSWQAQKALGNWMKKKGVEKPHTWLGAAAAALYLGLGDKL